MVVGFVLFIVYETTVQLRVACSMMQLSVMQFIEQLHLSLLTVMLALVVGWKECQSLHKLVTLWDGYITVIELLGGLAVHIEPPVTLQNRLVKQSRFWTEKTFHDEPVICESTHVEHLQTELKINFRFSPCIFKVNHFYWPTNAFNFIKHKG